MSTFYNVLNDVAFKKVFNNHANLTKNFLNATLRLDGDKAIKEVQFLPQELLPIISESKKSILDVKCTDQRGFQYIVEVQNKVLQPYLQRVQYYVSKTYSSQLRGAHEYLELKPVTLLSILNNNLFEEDINYLSFHTCVETETQRSYLNDMSYAFIELPKFTKVWEELRTPEEYWIYLLKSSQKLKEMPEKAPQDIKDALTILEEHAWSEEERDAYDCAKMAVLDDQAAKNTAFNLGKYEGKAEGVHEVARNLKRKGISVSLISETTGLSEEDIRKL